MQLCKLTFQDGGCTEYMVIARCLEFALQFDQLDIANLACLELLSRRFQLLEEKYRHRMPMFDKGGPDADADASLFLGLGTASAFGRSAICVMPSLSQYIGEELARKAAVSKGNVKAHEFREKPKAINKGGGGGE